MKLRTLTTLASLASSALAAAPSAAIYTYAASSASTSTPSSIPTLAPSNARLILADALGISHHHSLSGTDGATLSLLSDQQTPLFETPKKKVWVFVDQVREVNDVLPEARGRRREIARLSSIPSVTDNNEFVAEVGAQARGEDVEMHYVSLSSSADGYKTAAAKVAGILKPLISPASLATTDVVVLLVPEKATTCRQSDCWYASGLRKRAQEEPLLSLAESAVPSRPVLPMASGNGSAALVNTTMPRCSGSESACRANTNACSGHGKCVLKYTNREEKTECWTCACESSPEKWGVQYWGGAACQKKDISVQFWLFAGFSIFGTAAVAWALGMLYTMGDAELPSVLSAGVAPTTRK